MPSTDPLDAADFNPTAHINRLFPNEESLAEVDAHVGGLQERMRELDEEVLRTVRQQTSAGSSARKDLENAKASVAELFLKVLGVGLAVGVGVGAGAGAGAGARVGVRHRRLRVLFLEVRDIKTKAEHLTPTPTPTLTLSLNPIPDR